MNDFHKCVQTNEKWQLMENKRSINNKNVKQLLENDYLLIHFLSRWIENCRRPLWEDKKMCWDSHQILIKLNQATHLLILFVSDIKNYENDNIFLEKH